MMSKFTKPLALGLATAFIVTTSAAAVAACNGNTLGQSGSQGPTTHEQSQSNGYFGNQAGRQLGSRMGPGQGGHGQYGNGQGNRLGNRLGNGQGHGNHGQAMQESTSESIIFEIVDKEGCTTDACTTLVLQDAYGHRITVGAVAFDDALTADASLDELTYHLAQNGSAVKGRLELGGADGDATRTYNLHVEQIYS